MQILCFINSCSCSPFMIKFRIQIFTLWIFRKVHSPSVFSSFSPLGCKLLTCYDPILVMAPEFMWTHLVPDCLLCATVNRVWLLKDSSYFSLAFGNKSGSFTAMLLTNLELLLVCLQSFIDPYSTTVLNSNH